MSIPDEEAGAPIPPVQPVAPRQHPAPKRWAVLCAALGSGIGAGLLGTSLHGHAHFTADSVIPWGSALALLLLVWRLLRIRIKRK